MRLPTLLASLVLALPAFAQDAPPPATRLDFPSVAAALKEVEARDGNGTIVTRTEGWTIANEPLAAAQWSFTPEGHYAHPSVVRRIIKRAQGNTTVETASLCEAPREACDKLLVEFASLNDRITQAVKARGRQGSTPPVQ